MSSDIVIMLTGILVACACALLGSFLVLRKMAMMADAISHAILPGIVAGYFLADGPNLLAGFLGAAAASLLTVTLVESLQNTRRVGSESAIGIVFPAMFALGTFLVSKYFANVHLDMDAILYGNIEFAPFDVLYIGDMNLGPQSLWVMSGLCLINLAFVTLFYKELKLATFDPGLAVTLGFSPTLLNYALMAVVSVTAAGAFTAVGAILVIALIIVPAAAAYLLTERLPVMIALAALIGALAAMSGYGVASIVDASVSGSMGTLAGVLFGLVLLFSPSHGLVAKARRRRRQRAQFASEMLVVHLFNHEDSAQQEAESAVSHLERELRWKPDFARNTINRAAHEGWIERTNGHLELTSQGRNVAQQVIAR